jgi:hypothetical protein
MGRKPEVCHGRAFESWAAYPVTFTPRRSTNTVIDSTPAPSRLADAALLFACAALILGSIVASFW